MLTRRGWGTAGLAVVTVLAGRVLGVAELYVVGTTLLAIAIIAAVWVSTARLRLGVVRRVRPARLHAGDDSRVQLSITNRARRSTPIMELRDPVSGTPGAVSETGPVRRGETTQLAYRLPTDRRGILRIGPLRLSVVDPLGMAAVHVPAAPVTEVTVFPRVLPLAPIPASQGPDRFRGAEVTTSLGRVGDELYALRDYVVGDDLRRVHWPSTARRGDLMVRQDEQAWHGRSTVLLDLRRDVHHGESLELAVTAAASLVVAAAGRRDLVRLVATDGTDSGFGSGRAHADAVLEELATVGASTRRELRATLRGLRRDALGGTLVLVTTELDPAGRHDLLRAGAAFSTTYTVEIHPSAHEAGAPPPSGPPGPNVARWDGTVGLEEAWLRALGRSGAGVPT